MIVLALDEFAAKRRRDQESLEARLLQHVEEAVGDLGDGLADWTLALMEEIDDAFFTVYQQEGGQGAPSQWTLFRRQIGNALEETSPTSDPELIATWLATAILNAATLAAASNDPEFLVMEWVTMHDGDVRETHRLVEGQQRPPGEPFIVGGEEMPYPGYPGVRPDLWINCRCALAPAYPEEASFHMETAAVEKQTSLTIMALPEQADPTHEVGPEQKHMTLLWLGEGEGVDREAVHAAVKAIAASAPGPLFEGGVQKRGTLGDEGAEVWFLDADPAVELREALLSDETISAAFNSVEQYPDFTPHVTIGYMTEETVDEYDWQAIDTAAAEVSTITFDRLAVWDGETQTEYALGEQMPENEEETVVAAAVPWHGVLAPEGKWSGDGRQFAEGALTFRDLPVPLTWQKASGEGHNGSVTVARIDHIARVDGEMRGTGVFLQQSDTADEVVGMIAEFGRFGVSVDADDAEFEFDEESGKVTFTSARIASASIVAIPAFAEAWVALGEAPEGFLDGEMELVAAGISDKSWDGSASRFTPEQWYKSTIVHLSDDKENKSDHKLPIREPDGALSRAGVHAAAGRLNQTDAPSEKIEAAKKVLRGAYRKLGEEPPEAITASAEFKRGKGWITHPADTKRIHDYWTRPGEPGFIKIGWGKGGDFNRCRVLVGEKIAKNSPEDLRYINQICAQWHHDALGIWPGEHKAAAEEMPFDAEKEQGVAVTLVAAGAGHRGPAAWFSNPNLTEPTPLTVTEEGRVFGHIAQWGTCHIGFDGVCVEPPRSQTNYGYFTTGSVLLDDGSFVRTGVLSVGGGHAAPGLRWRAAIEHYDSTSTAVSDVAVGDDEHGIWVAGWVRPGATDEQITTLRASAISGDWREIGDNLELVAALSVNTPGFPVRVAASNGRQVALVAAGMVQQVAPPEEFNMEVFAAAVADAIEARQKRRERVAALAARVEGATGGM
jgi:2'-5' RNA ligase